VPLLPALLVTLLAGARSCCTHSLTADQLAVLNGWMKSYPTYRQARDRDSSCPADIEQMRRGYDSKIWKPVPDYHPYQAVGDFNSDGKVDFAAVLIDTKRTEEPFAPVIFNGPISKARTTPAFFEAGFSLACGGLFFGPPRPEPYRLVVGPFESDNTGVLEPDGPAYTWDDSSDDERRP